MNVRCIAEVNTLRKDAIVSLTKWMDKIYLKWVNAKHHLSTFQNWNVTMAFAKRNLVNCWFKCCVLSFIFFLPGNNFLARELLLANVCPTLRTMSDSSVLIGKDSCFRFPTDKPIRPVSTFSTGALAYIPLTPFVLLLVWFLTQTWSSTTRDQSFNLPPNVGAHKRKCMETSSFFFFARHRQHHQEKDNSWTRMKHEQVRAWRPRIKNLSEILICHILPKLQSLCERFQDQCLIW